MSLALSNPPQTETREELVATFARIVHPKGRLESVRQFVIAFVDVDDGHSTARHSVKGECNPDELLPGIRFKFFGKWGKSQNRGDRQFPAAFEFSQVVRMEPHSRGGMCQYLTKFAPGIGYATAGTLWDAFGSEAARTLRSDPEEVAKRLPKLPISTLKAASEALKLHAATEDTRIELATLFDGRGFPAKLVDHCIAKWGVHAPRIIRHDPFKLLINRMPGCGFDRCDKLYMDLGLPPDRMKRQFACIWRKLQEDSSGHTWHPIRLAAEAVKEKISGCTEENLNWKKALLLGQRAGWIKVVSYPVESSGIEPQKQYWIAEARKADAEDRLVESIAAIMKAEPKHRWPDVDAISAATPHQREVARKIFSAPIAILGGSPGTGKTTATAMILRELVNQVGPHAICVCAPTNAAAVRIGLSLDRSGLDQVARGTVHGMLGVERNGHDKNGWSFYHCKSRPLPYDVVVIDEASMESAEDGADLFDAIRPGSLVLVVGDINQLLPVGHGAPMRDMISAGVPFGELTEVLRNGGDGLEGCRAIRDGRLPKASQKIDLANGGNWMHRQSGNGKQSLFILQALCRTIGGMQIPSIDGRPATEIDPIRDVQVIVALNEKGECNRKAVNTLLQTTLNPHGMTIEGIPFRQGDKLICSDKIILPLCAAGDASGDFREIDPQQFEEPGDDDKVPEAMIVKGEIGIVESVRTIGVFVRFAGPDRLVFIPRRGGEKSAMSAFELAYAITYHKSQGSQFPIVICLIDKAADRVACRELWYVGTSRFETLLITIGDLGVLFRQCRRVALRERKTFLAERLKERLA